jgi:hypothetical protein
MKHKVMRLPALLVVLAACGGGDDEGEATATTDATTADDGEGALDGRRLGRRVRSHRDAHQSGPGEP